MKAPVGLVPVYGLLMLLLTPYGLRNDRNDGDRLRLLILTPSWSRGRDGVC